MKHAYHERLSTLGFGWRLPAAISLLGVALMAEMLSEVHMRHGRVLASLGWRTAAVAALWLEAPVLLAWHVYFRRRLVLLVWLLFGATAAYAIWN